MSFQHHHRLQRKHIPNLNGSILTRSCYPFFIRSIFHHINIFIMSLYSTFSIRNNLKWFSMKFPKFQGMITSYRHQMRLRTRTNSQRSQSFLMTFIGCLQMKWSLVIFIEMDTVVFRTGDKIILNHVATHNSFWMVL